MKLRITAAILIILAASCGRGGSRAAPEDEWQEYSGPAWPAMARLQTGANPLWFELGEKGLHLIDSPAAAALIPFTPWPDARYITGMLLWEGFLVMAANGDGFFVLGQGSPGSGNLNEVVLYKSEGGDLWNHYTAESFFIWDDRPAVLLYRNDFFSDPVVPPLKPQVFVLDVSSPAPLGVSIPALEKFPGRGTWETELVRRGPDAYWYYRMKNKEQNETAYFRTEDLTKEGKSITVGEWRNSERPDGQRIPVHLAAILAHAAEQVPGKVYSSRVVSPGFEGQRFYSITPIADMDNFALMYGFCREIPQPLALAVFSDGSGFYSNGEGMEVRPFLLTPLPEGFVYTGIAVLGNVLAASWEEQLEAGIGAAGFMVVALSTGILN